MMCRFKKLFVTSVTLFLAMAALVLMAPAAEVDGAWTIVLNTEIGDRPMPITLKQQGEEVSGSLGEFLLKGSFRDGKLSLKAADFYAPEAGFKADLVLEGSVEGNAIAGRWSFGEYAGSMRGEKTGGTAAASAPNPSGTWDLVLITEVGDKPARITLQADGETVKGTAGEMSLAGTFREGALNLKIPDFYSPDAGFKADLNLQGKVEGDTLVQGRWTFAEYSGSLRGSRSAQ